MQAPGAITDSTDRLESQRSVKPRSPTVVSIQYLRGAAAMIVVLCHIGSHARVNWTTGAAGVDVFFVISGFIIWTVTARQPRSPGAFLADRLTRLAPAYVLLTIAIYLIATRIKGVFPDMHTNLLHAVLSALFIPHTDPYGTAFPLVIPGWTLNYEMFFYVVFACCLTAPAKSRIWLVTGLLCISVVGGLLIAPANVVLSTYSSPLLLEFVAGIWLAAAWQRDRVPSAAAGAIAMLAGISALLAWQMMWGTAPVQYRALAWGIPAVLIVGGAITMERRMEIGRSRLLLVIGDASFSIYLINVFVAAAVWRVIGAFSAPVYCVVALLACVGGGIVFWRLVERPLTRLARKAIRPPAQRPRPSSTLAQQTSLTA